jgi:hypothetical protein
MIRQLDPPPGSVLAGHKQVHQNVMECRPYLGYTYVAAAVPIVLHGMFRHTMKCRAAGRLALPSTGNLPARPVFIPTSGRRATSRNGGLHAKFGTGAKFENRVILMKYFKRDLFKTL